MMPFYSLTPQAFAQYDTVDAKKHRLFSTYIPLAAPHWSCNRVILSFTQSYLAQQTQSGTCMKLHLAKINQEIKILLKAESLHLSCIPLSICCMQLLPVKTTL